MDSFWAGAVAGYGIAVPVGAIAVLIVDLGIRHGFRPAFFAGAGAASADLAYSTLAVLGGAALTRAVSGIGDDVRVVSGLVLLVIGLHGLWRVGRRKAVPVHASPASAVAIYARFLGLTIINPMTVVYFAAVVIGLGVVDGMGWAEGTSFVTGAFLASLSWQTLLATVGWRVGARLSPRARMVASTLGNLVVLAMAVFILT